MIPEKISAGLLVALRDYQTEGKEVLTPHKRSLGIISTESSPKPARTVVFIYCDEDAQLDHLQEELGIQINQSTGTVRTAFLPMESLDPLSEEPAIHRIKPSRYLRPLMDVAPGKVNLPQFKTGTGRSGKGVVIGLVDPGIDPNHPALKGRIVGRADQTLPVMRLSGGR